MLVFVIFILVLLQFFGSIAIIVVELVVIFLRRELCLGWRYDFGSSSFFNRRFVIHYPLLLLRVGSFFGRRSAAITTATTIPTVAVSTTASSDGTSAIISQRRTIE